MDLVIYPFDRGVEDRQHPGVFEWDAGNGVVIVFVPDPQPDANGICWIAVAGIAYGE